MAGLLETYEWLALYKHTRWQSTDRLLWSTSESVPRHATGYSQYADLAALGLATPTYHAESRRTVYMAG